MKIAILTFQFAHNYGAQLQAYALKNYITSQGCEVDIAPYYPEIFRRAYENDPFASNISIKKRLRRLLFYRRKQEQYKLFTTFQKDSLKLSNSITDKEKIESYLNRYDAVVFGSDQIWNTDLTGDSAEVYFGEGINTRKIAYAASVGSKVLTERQKVLIKQNLPAFESVSVRERNTKQMFEGLVDKRPEVVLDPVFLLDTSQWEKLALQAKINVPERYMLLYFLKDDSILLQHARNYAAKQHIEILEVHPTVAKFHTGTNHLKNVGPYEFLYLIANAECVCTNSFHATAFSVIFQKLLLHIPNCLSPDRTKSLLESIGMKIIDGEQETPLYKLSYSNKLYELKLYSKSFLDQALS